MDDNVKIGISTCPNDTFAFAGLLTEQTDSHGIRFHFSLLDIDELNRSLFSGNLDVGKASFFAALRMADKMYVLPSGSALGFGVGPLLLSSVSEWSSERLQPNDHSQRLTILSPGEHTTANLLLKIFHAGLLEKECVNVEQVLFSEIMPRLESGSADLGVCIHEGRFTWKSRNLFLVEDLGARWEKETGMPLPLGGILADKSLPTDVLTRVQLAIRDSLEWACASPSLALPVMRYHAQEFGDQVLLDHVRLYVNQWTRDLGDVGARSLDRFFQLACSKNIVESKSGPLEIFPMPGTEE